MATRENTIHYCGNCGRRIQAHQAKMEIKNFNKVGRFRGLQHFHESWAGCVESNRQNERVRISATERVLQGLTPAISYTSMEISGPE